MTRASSRGLLLTGGVLALAAAVSVVFLTFNGAGARGIAVGIALGIVNLVAGLLLTRRSLHRDMMQVTGTVLGGFAARLAVVVGLFFIFKQTSTIDAPAFALSFVAFFFVYLVAEIIMVEQSLSSRSAT